MNPPPPAARPRRWVLFFVVLAALAATAVVVPIVYNLSIQLKPEELDAARRRWQENAPADYDLACLVKDEHEGREAIERQYLVKVRAGRVVLVVDGNEVVYVDPSLAVVAGPAPWALSTEDPARIGVPALFDEMEAALRQDESSARRNYATASFDPHDGHPSRYVHRVRGTHDRVEWVLKLTRVRGEQGASAP
jgi:hypothetical protein